MSSRKPLAALAAATAALALAIPTASASAGTISPVAHRPFTGPGSLYCQIVYRDLVAATDTGRMWTADFLSNVFVDTGCGGAAI